MEAQATRGKRTEAELIREASVIGKAINWFLCNDNERSRNTFRADTCREQANEDRTCMTGEPGVEDNDEQFTPATFGDSDLQVTDFLL